MRLSKRGSVLVLCKFFDQVHNPSSYLGVADPHERFNERQPVACCHEILSMDRTKAAGRGGRRQRARPQRRMRSALAGYGKPAAAELELTRFVPFSYFWTCWNVMPSASPSSDWLMSNIIRRIRRRLPTCWSMGLGDFWRVIVSSHRRASTGRSSILASFWWPRFAACVGEQSHTQNCGFHVRCWHHRQRL